MEILNKVLELIGKPEVVAVCVIVVESLLRLIKTNKPASILHVVSGVLKVAGDACSKIALFLDKVLPQNVLPKE